jgi:hypothetical protein
MKANSVQYSPEERANYNLIRDKVAQTTAERNQASL